MINWTKQVSDGAVLLTVNQRLSRHQMARYQHQQMQLGNDWWETPDILPFRSWMNAVHRQALGMGLCELTRVPPLLVQRAWRRIIDSDTSVNLLDGAGAAHSALQAWELSCAWHCNNPEEQYLSADQFAWQRWMKRYRAWLDGQKGVDESLLADVLGDVLRSATAEQRAALLPQTLILDGFIQLPTQLQRLMNVINDCGTQVQHHETAAHAVVHIDNHADDDTEMLSIAAQMRAELEHDPHQSLGLVVPDLQQRRDAVVRAFDRVFYPAMSPLEIHSQSTAYEISLGQSLGDQPLIAMALLLLRLSAGSLNSHELSAVLLSPYWKGAGAEARRREQLDRHLRDRRVSSLTLEQFSAELHKASALVPACKAVLQQRNLHRTSLAEWAGRFSHWLQLLGWPGSSIDSTEHQCVSAWMECLDDMQLLDDGQLLSIGDASGQLKMLVTERVFQVETPAKPIQVMGRLESHGLDFDCLWVAGLDDEQWPPAGSASPFLSVSEQKACGVPGSSAAQRLSLAEKEFRQWASQAPLLVISSALNRDGKQLNAALLPQHEPGAQSRELAQSRLARLQQVGATDDPIRMIAQSLALEPVVDDVGPALAPGTKVDGGARLFENQALCPFRAFALHRLKIRPLEETGIGLDPRQHGNLLHNALEHLWKTLVTQQALLALSEPELDATIEAAVCHALEQNKVPGELQTLESMRLGRLLREWVVNCEVPRPPFEVIAFEEKKRIEHGGVVMDVVIDRIDEVDGAAVVIDYKTGTGNRVAPWADSRIANPQLPLYVLTDEHIMAASFAQVAVNRCQFIGIASEEQMLPGVSTRLKGSRSAHQASEPITEWADWRTHWRESLDSIAREIRQGVATITPMKGACTYCELKSLCRISNETLTHDNADAAAGQDESIGVTNGVLP